MKKWIAIALLVVMVIGLTACGPINKNDVAIVWYINDKATNPNDAINSMERAMYIENIAYKHYGAGGSAAIQLEMAQSALASGCAALMVEIRDNSVAQDLVNAAKSYDIPIILFNHAVDQEIVASYDKCYNIVHDSTTIYGVQAQQIVDGKGATGNTDKNLHPYDRNGDGKVTYIGIGNVSFTAGLLDNNTYVALAQNASVSTLDSLTIREGDGRAELIDAAEGSVEMILTNADTTALQVLDALQKHGFNKDKLTTHNIPVLTVGNTSDAKRFTNTENMTEEELKEFVYTATDLIGEERLAGSVIADLDTMSLKIADLLAKLIKGKTPDMEGRVLNIPYIGI